MGIFDEYRDSNSTITLAGDKGAAAQYIPQARKFAEIMQGKLDLGTNLGMDYKDTITLDKNTIMNVRLSPGVTNPTMHIEISSNPAVAPEPVAISKDTDYLFCPRLPMSKPGARMFTHLFDHDVQGAPPFLKNPDFRQNTARKVKTDYILPTSDQGAYCSTDGEPGSGNLLFHNEVDLSRPFQVLGGPSTKLFLHSHWIGLRSPNVFLSFPGSVIPLNMPCDCEYPGFPTFTPNPEVLGPGNNFVLCMEKNFGTLCFPNRSFDGDTYLVEGSVSLPVQKLLNLVNSEDDPNIDHITRDFALINWTSDFSEHEIVFLYPAEGCPAAVGFFFGGLSGIRETTYGGHVTSLLCTFSVAAGPCLTQVGSIPDGWGGYFVGAQRQAIAYTSCFESAAQRSTTRADENLGGRSFWFVLNEDGFPNGQGIHNSPEGFGREFDLGDGDLRWNDPDVQ